MFLLFIFIEMQFSVSIIAKERNHANEVIRILVICFTILHDKQDNTVKYIFYFIPHHLLKCNICESVVGKIT